MTATLTQTLSIHVFGKAGCQKCQVLKGRIDSLLKKPEWHGFSMAYHDIETEDGMVAFCKLECLNPQRIPGFVIMQTDENGDSQPVLNPNPGAPDDVTKQSKLFQYLGLQTDYSPAGKGLITPKMIQAILYEAREVCDL